MTFLADKTFEEIIYTKYKNREYSTHSGIYKYSGNSLELIYTHSDLLSFNPNNNKSNRAINWLDSNTTIISGNGIKCHAYRKNVRI